MPEEKKVLVIGDTIEKMMTPVRKTHGNSIVKVIDLHILTWIENKCL